MKAANKPKRAALDLTALAYLARPYAWISHAMIGVAAASAAGKDDLTSLLFAATLAVGMYVFLCLLIEFKHQHSGRPSVPIAYPIAAGAILALAFSRDSTALLLYAAVVTFAWAYALKNTQIGGAFSPISRGFGVSAQFFAIYFMFASAPSAYSLSLASVLFALTAGRNLLGDLRDLKYDLNTVPKTFGAGFSRTVCAGLFVASALIAFFVLKTDAGLIPLAFSATLIFSTKYFALHRLAMVVTTAFLVFLVWGAAPIALVLIVGDALASMLFYKKIFRESNKTQTVKK